MDNFEKKLNSFPKYKFGFVADIKLRTYIVYKSFIKKNKSLKFARLKPVLAFILILSILVTVPSYAYASPKVNNSHFLYPIKVGLEAIELDLTRDGAKKTRTLLKFSGKRIEEAEVLSETPQKEKYIAATVDSALDLTKKAKENSKGIADQKEKEKSFQEIENSANLQKKKTEVVAKNVGLEADDKVIFSIVHLIREFDQDINEGFEDEEIEEPSKREEIRTRSKGTSTREDLRKREDEEEKKYRRNKKNDNELERKKEKINDSLLKAKKDIDKIDNDLSDKYKKEDIEILHKKLELQVEKAGEALKNDDTKESEDIIESAKLLKDYSEHFIEKKTDADKDEEDEPVMDVKEEEFGGEKRDRREEEKNEEVEIENKGESEDKEIEKRRDNKD